MATEASNNIKVRLATQLIDFSSDTFHLILMDSSFTFDKDNDDTYGDIKWDGVNPGLEHANGTTGYSLKGLLLQNVSVNRDDANDKYTITWDDIEWTSAGTGLSSKGACIIHGDGTSDAHYVVGFIDFSTTRTISAGGKLIVANVTVDIT